jgi:hypothetical protein
MSVALIIVYGMVAIAGATLLSIWSGTLIVRVLALRVERRAVRKLRIAWEAKQRAERRDDEGTIQDREPAISAAAAVLHPARDGAILAIAPVVFIAGLVMTWIVGRFLEGNKLLEEKYFDLAMATAVEFVVAGSFLGAWWWLGRTVHPRTCPHCGYDMRATQGSMCTECGRESSEYALTRKRPKRILLLVPVLLVCVSYVTVKWEGIRKGWFELVPTTLLIAAMEFIPGSWIDAGPGSAFAETCLNKRIERMWRWQYQWFDSRYFDLARSTQDVNTYVSIVASGLRSRVPPPPHGAIAADVYKEIGRRLAQGDEGLSLQFTWMMYYAASDPVLQAMCDAIAPEVIGELKRSLQSPIRNLNTSIIAICLQSTAHRAEAEKLILEVARDPASSEDELDRLAQSLAWIGGSVGNARQVHITLMLDPTTRMRDRFVSVLVEGWAPGGGNLLQVYMQLETDADGKVASIAWRGMLKNRAALPAITTLLERARQPEETVLWMIALRDMEYSMSEKDWQAVLALPEFDALLKVAEDPATPVEARNAILHEITKHLCTLQKVPRGVGARVLEAGRACRHDHPAFNGGNELGSLGSWIETLDSKMQMEMER